MVVTIDRNQIRNNISLWCQVQQHFETYDCTCGRYTVYYECGHIIAPPTLFRCERTISNHTRDVILCYRPARLVDVFSVNIRGRCRHCA